MSDTDRRRRLCAAVSILVLAGCAGRDLRVSLTESRAAATAPGRVAGLLLGSDDEEEGYVSLLALAPAPVEQPAPRATRLGIRGGYLLTGEAEQPGWNPSFCAGVYFRRAKPPSPRAVYELGADYIPLERDDGAVSTTLYLLRAELLWGSWRMEDRSTSFYLLVGGNVISENGVFNGSEDSGSNLAYGVNLGLGLGSTRGRWDLRGVYSRFPVSTNVKDNVLVAMGFAF
jgi:hypothetical protein